jgi:hypothetical protein
MREGQEVWHRAELTPSMRTDLDDSWAPSYTIPKPGVNYFDAYDWDYIVSAFEAGLARMRQIIAARN